MARKATGSRLSDADPSPPQPVLRKIGKASQRKCLHCREVPAKEMHIIGFHETEAVFCCTLCAYMFAIEHIMKVGISWCWKHSIWTGENGHCRKCIELAELARPDGCIREIPEGQDGEAVNHDR